MLLTFCGFHENRIREVRTFVLGVNEITFTRVPSSHGSYDLRSWLSFHNISWIVEKVPLNSKECKSESMFFYQSRPAD